MRILFAVSNEKDSEAITKQYQQEFKEEITKKNVYYFNAIQKELQKDKVYDKIVISEDLEAFSNNNYVAIDKFIAEKISNIVDEAENSISAGAQIVIICNDRREKSCEMLLRFWELGIYNALIGKDRNIKTICSILNKPRTKNEAKVYYAIETEDGRFDSDNGETVSEVEIQNILIHYKKLGKNEDKYVESFNSIAMQYTDTQLKLIIGFLPLNVKAVLEERCDKYQQLVTSSNIKAGKKATSKPNRQQANKKAVKAESTAEEPAQIEEEPKESKKSKKSKKSQINTQSSKASKLIEKQFGKTTLTKPVVIPTNVNLSAIKKVGKKADIIEDTKIDIDEKPAEEIEEVIDNIPEVIAEPQEETIPEIDNFDELDLTESKNEEDVESLPGLDDTEFDDIALEDTETEDIQSDDIEELNESLPDEKDSDVLPGFDDFDELEITDSKDETDNETLPGLNFDEEDTEVSETDNIEDNEENNVEEDENVLPGFDELDELDLTEDTENSDTDSDTLPGVDDMFDDIENEDVTNSEEEITETPKRGRGRPKKIRTEEELAALAIAPKRGRGRPKKIKPEEEVTEELNETLPDEEESVDLFDLNDEENEIEENNIEDSVNLESDTSILPGFDDLDELDLTDSTDSNNDNDDDENVDEYATDVLPGFDDEQDEADVLPGTDDGLKLDDDFDDIMNEIDTNDDSNSESTSEFEDSQKNELENTTVRTNVDIASLLTRDKKIVSFVGTSKNGTSFLVNNLAQMISEKGIKTAILDLTKNKNAYYVYTDNQEELRNITFTCFKNLVNGNPTGIEINKNLTVFTAAPGEDEGIENYLFVLDTLLKNYSLVLLDCDFNTNYGYFKESQEIYLVQSYDVLTIQPLTAFLRDLKAKNVLNTENLRVVLNKEIKVRNATAKAILGGMSIYNDPAMSFMTELFNKDLIKYCSIPFETQTYSRYLEGLVECKISLKGYSKSFLMYLSKLAKMVYPLLDGGYGKKTNNTNYDIVQKEEDDKFSAQMNDTLNKMKNKY